MNAKEQFIKVLPVSTFAIIEDVDNNIWFGTGNGLFIIKPSTNEFIHITHSEYASSLTANLKNCLLKDRNNNVWIGTTDGISIYNSTNKEVMHFEFERGNINSLSDNYITSIEEDNLRNQLWIGTKNEGLNILNLKKNTIERFTGINGNSIAAPNIKTLYLDQKRRLWVGLWAGIGFSKLDLSVQKIENYRYNKINTYSDWYQQFFIQNDDSLWISLWGASGLLLFDLNKKQFIDYQQNMTVELNYNPISEIIHINENEFLIKSEDSKL